MYMLLMAVARSSSDDSLCTSGLWKTLSLFHIMEPIDQNQARRYNSSRSPSCGTGAKSDVYVCLVISLLKSNMLMLLMLYVLI